MDKINKFVAPRPVQTTSKRATAPAGIAPSTSKKVAPKVKNLSRKSVLPCNLNTSTALFCDETIFEPEALSDVEATDDYVNFLRSMLLECQVEEKIEREETQMDIQLTQLAGRLRETMDQLDQTSRRLKDINFVVEQKRLADLKNQDCSNFYNMIENSGSEEKISNLTTSVDARMDNLKTLNVDFGYNNETGHKKLLDTVNDTINGLESIKKKYNFNTNIFDEYKEFHTNLDAFEKNRFNLDSMKNELEVKFPKYSEKLLKDISNKVASFMENDD
ncbi:myosin heavy chain, clone 203-like [Maniola hyperantus]|uniref:myosin heavy chain, clone 203-like n=1 Tax=Aphantopus hyperantus TaxID=2795564 RepID=UPI001569FEFC|nr:uncharacterized protein LOC117995219 [Maniola hyperantus]XP_034839114.1 uncharacterized protein LOC117995219 [Maniola hyperantus]